MTTKTITPAKNVISAFPTFKQLLSDPAYKAQIFEDKGTQFWINVAITAGSELGCADMVAMIINHMVTSMTEKPFYNSYDMTTAKSKTNVLDFYGNKHEVTRDEFQALLKVFWFSYLGIQMTEAQFEPYCDFKSIPKIYRIMD